MDKSLVKYGQELGPNLLKVAKKLCKNENLAMLLDNSDLDPLNRELHPNKINGVELLNKLIRIVPLVQADEQSTKSKLVILFTRGQINSTNSDNENIVLTIAIYCPFKEWLITGDTIRPFAIMSEVRKSLQHVRINGLGEIQYEGFDLSTLTEEMGAYIMRFEINAFS